MKEQVNRIEKIKDEITSNIELVDLLEVEPDQTLETEVEETTKKLENDVEKIKLLVLLSGPYDKNNCILEIHPGAGGTESCDWANMLYRMYTRWCEKNNYKIIVLD